MNLENLYAAFRLALVLEVKNFKYVEVTLRRIFWNPGD